MMIRDHNIHTAGANVSDLVDRGDPAVYGHDHRRSSIHQHIECPTIESVAVSNSMRNEYIWLDAESSQEGIQDAARGEPIHVVIAIDRDSLILLYGSEQSIGRFSHPFQHEGVPKNAQIGHQEASRILRRPDASIDQELCEQR